MREAADERWIMSDRLDWRVLKLFAPLEIVPPCLVAGLGFYNNSGEV
jgi:hypothetical protein